MLSVDAVFKFVEAILLITAKIAQRTAAVATERATEANYVQIFIILMCYDECSAKNGHNNDM